MPPHPSAAIPLLPPAASADRRPPTAPAPFGPNPTTAEAALLPAKLQWALVGWYRQCEALAAAEALLTEIAARGGETARLLDEQAKLALAAGCFAEAEALLAERANRSGAASAWVALARLHLEMGDLDAAAAISDDLSAEHPELVTVGALAADVARSRGDLATARAYHEAVLAERPDHAASLLGLARVALLERAPREAAALLDRVAATEEGLTANQLATAAAIAELCDQPTRAAVLRHRALRVETARAEALAAAIAEALGGAAPPTPQSWEEHDEAPPTPRFRGEPATAASLPSSPPPLHSREGLGEGASRPPPGIGGPAPSEPTPVAIPEAPVAPPVLEALQRDFGHDALRPGQAAVIANVLAERDTLAIMPTGAGKSLTFQLPALLLDGTTLVISPLIALMKDQVDSLPPAVRERTALVNSTLSPEEQRRVLADLADGAYKLVYAAPERLRQHAFLRALRAAGTALVVVDEAHCISLWGHDFRPDYLTIPAALPELGDPPVLAITATATPRIAAAIAAGFGRELDRVRISVFRSNLFYEVHHLAGREEKIKKVVEVCREERGAGIVYVSSRKDAEAIAGLLRDRGVGAIPYHAGLDPETRARNQERFMRGQTRVVVATVAFGMGVDKRDVRFIVHLNPPRSLEAYAQESGRAGRDGEPARCVLLTAPADRTSLNRLARRDEQDLDTLRRVYAGVKRAAAGRWATVDPESLLPPASYDDEPEEEADPRIALGLLEQADLVRRHPDAPVNFTLRATERAPGVATAATADADAGRWARFVAWSGLDRAGRAGVTVRTVETCETLDCSPVELARLLESRPEVTTREGPRLVCLELRPVGSDAGARLAEILARSRQEAQGRIQLVLNYAAGHRCRHVTLANHLGEALAPCGTACDICAGTAAPRGRTRATAAGTDGAPPARSHLTAGDALAVLRAVRTLPFPMGKTGLTKLLLGSVESRVRADRTPAFGALAEVKKGKVEGLIDRLVEDGFLLRDLDHEYKLIQLTERGAAATADDLAEYEERPKVTREAGSRAARRDAGETAGLGAEVELDAEGEALLKRLVAWRRERSLRDGLSPAYVAHNETLRELAVRRPASLAQLGRVSGLGPKKIEKYGDELLALIEQA